MVTSWLGLQCYSDKAHSNNAICTRSLIKACCDVLMPLSTLCTRLPSPGTA